MFAPPVSKAQTKKAASSRDETPVVADGEAPSIVQEVLDSPGQPLTAANRTAMESRFGVDFSHVRVHSDARAARSAAMVHAAAYTVGSDIVLPAHATSDSAKSVRLLAHELAHVVQGGSRSQGQTNPIRIEPSTSGREVAARQAAHDALSRQTPTLARIGAAAPVLFRQEIGAPELEEVPADQSTGVNLPTASKQGTDPRNTGDYIDKKVTAVGYGIYVGGFLVFCEGMPHPFLVPESEVDFGGATYESVGSQIFQDRQTAIQALPYGPYQANQALPYAYFRAPQSSIVAPTMLSTATTPRIVGLARGAMLKLKQEVQHDLTVLALQLAGGLLLSAVMSGLTSLAEAKLSGTKAKVDAEARAQGRLAGEEPAPGRTGEAAEPAQPGTARPVATSSRPQANVQQLRGMIANSGEYFTFRTPRPDVASNQPIKFTGENTPATAAEHARVDSPPPQGVYLTKGLKGLPYGNYAVAIKGANYHIRSTPDPLEFVLDGEIPANEGVWYTADDYALATKKTAP
ncbi:MAG: DUF4157 domain-containing protein [Candidatus Cybelea sp.]